MEQDEKPNAITVVSGTRYAGAAQKNQIPENYTAHTNSMSARSAKFSSPKSKVKPVSSGEPEDGIQWVKGRKIKHITASLEEVANIAESPTTRLTTSL